MKLQSFCCTMKPSEQRRLYSWENIKKYWQCFSPSQWRQGPSAAQESRGIWMPRRRAAVPRQMQGKAAVRGIKKRNLSVNTFTACIDEMLESHQLTMTNELKRTAALYKLFALLIESNDFSGEGTRYDYSSQSYLDHALQFIHFNFHKNIQISDIAEYVGITRSYLFQIFKQNLNESPKDYLLHYRMEHAKYLLETTNESIKGISAAVGYNDPLTFSKMFNSIIGVPPSKYRQI